MRRSFAPFNGMERADYIERLIELSPRLLRFAYRLKGDENALDLHSETICRAIEDYNLYDKDRPLFPFFATIMRNIHITECRRRACWYKYRDRIKVESKRTERADEGVGIDLELLERYRRTETRLFSEGYTYEEISRIVGACTGTIKSRLNYNRKVLSELLRE